jgi:hypothetical protein
MEEPVVQVRFFVIFFQIQEPLNAILKLSRVLCTLHTPHD